VKFLTQLIILTMSVLYNLGYAQISPRDLSKWEKVGNTLFPKDFANENVVVGTNTDTAGGNTYRFIVLEGNAFIGLLDNASPLKGIYMAYTGAIETRFSISDTQLELNCDNGAGSATELILTDNNIAIDVIDTATGEAVNIDIDKNRQLITATTAASITTQEIGFAGTEEVIEQGPLTLNKIFNNNGITFQVNGVDIFQLQNTILRPSPVKSIYPAFDDDAAAGAGGLVAGEHYQTTGAALPPLNVPGIVMVKQ
jgi:hypothetical protein